MSARLNLALFKCHSRSLRMKFRSSYFKKNNVLFHLCKKYKRKKNVRMSNTSMTSPTPVKSNFKCFIWYISKCQVKSNTLFPNATRAAHAVSTITQCTVCFIKTVVRQIPCSRSNKDTIPRCIRKENLNIKLGIQPKIQSTPSSVIRGNYSMLIVDYSRVIH